jgi:hypothetical protein
MDRPSREVIRKFRKRFDTAIDYHRELLLAVHQKRRQASLESMLAEQFALNIGVLWEVFLSDLLMAYVAEDPSTYLKGLKGRFSQSIREKFGNEVLRYITINLPDGIAVERVAAWLDPKDFNLSFKSSDALQTKANSLLGAQFAKKFTLEQERSQLLDFTFALRNYLAHRSLAARQQLQLKASVMSGPNAVLNARIMGVGPYLKERVAGGDSRATVFAVHLAALAETLG